MCAMHRVMTTKYWTQNDYILVWLNGIVGLVLTIEIMMF